MAVFEIARRLVGGVWTTEVVDEDTGGGGAPSGPAGGDLDGSYPDPGVAKVAGVVVDPSGGSTGDVLTQQSDGSFAPGEGGGSQPDPTQWAYWVHNGAPDDDSASFDFVGDLSNADPTNVVVVDDSEEWVSTGDASWGYPVPKVTETGLYRIRALMRNFNPHPPDDSIHIVFNLVVADGAHGANIAPHGVVRASAEVHSSFDAFQAPAAILDVTLPLPADAHLDFTGIQITGANASGPPDPDDNVLSLLIQRVG